MSVNRSLKFILRSRGLAIVWLCLVFTPLYAGFEITSVIMTPEAYTEQQLELLEVNLNRAERLWESVILGYPNSDENVEFALSVQATHSGLAAASTDAFAFVGEKVVGTRGTMFINVDEIVNVSMGGGLNPGLNVLDELIAHEIGHALGIGTLWVNNGLYIDDTGEYTGEFALAAYRAEFDPTAEFVPVELAGSAGSRNSHWNQLFRSSAQEGNPDDPLSLSPLLGITDARGRDFAQDLMSPAIDADFGEPFLSNTTVQSMRDLGFDVVPSFPLTGDIDGNGFIEVADIDAITNLIAEQSQNLVYDLNADGTISPADRTGLIKDIALTDFGDANFDGRFDSSDLVLVSQAAEYRDAIVGNSTWSTGDWDGDREFDTEDLLAAFKTGKYERQLAVLVPEPLFSIMLLLSCIAAPFRLALRASQSV